ncbi:hypothetical protein DUI87_08127 [Hirundo rustica rustica]|uniref:Reverse transcriptase domain-containing protein n=1 Tax=Hirundo rustica rustica TaxID=333673 RepID=A0A3M0KTC5_HIRRU|nr:hypothetical protein DUI87_08127 [Hirundo rustica rustica]
MVLSSSLPSLGLPNHSALERRIGDTIGPGWTIPWDHTDRSAVPFKETPSGEVVTHGSLSYGGYEREEMKILRRGREGGEWQSLNVEDRGDREAGWGSDSHTSSTQHSSTDPVLFGIFIHGLDTGPKGTINMFADTKLGGDVDPLEGRETLQRDLNKLERWSIINHMKFNMIKCRILCFRGDNPGCYTDWGRRCWRAALWKGPWQSWSVQAEHEPPVPWQPGGTNLS